MYMYQRSTLNGVLLQLFICTHLPFQRVLQSTVQLIDNSIKTGIPLDPDFTAKGARGLVSELQCNPQRFAGKRIIFINTGWIKFSMLCVRFWMDCLTHVGLSLNIVYTLDTSVLMTLHLDFGKLWLCIIVIRNDIPMMVFPTCICHCLIVRRVKQCKCFMQKVGIMSCCNPRRNVHSL